MTILQTMSSNYYEKNKPAILARLKKKRQELTQEQKEDIKIYNKEYYEKNRPRISKRHKKYSLTDAGIAVRKRASQKYCENNRDVINAKQRETYHAKEFTEKLAILQGNNL